ncbi:MAG: YkgJ family cysteine cluster protein [Gammaproteobacteria bacterium]|nr:YkgJ family cysteine cluster protein [Gammaproteobacteria bacterium]
MNIPATTLPSEPAVTCANCQACCCRLEVMLITETGVPERFIETDQWGGRTMMRLDDGWCAALNRDTLMCRIYAQRPLICREFAMGEEECVKERQASHSART